MRRKIAGALLIGGLILGSALGQSPAPTPTPAPQPAPQPQPAPVAIAGDVSVPCYGFARLRLTGSYTSAGWLCFPDRTTGASLVSSYTTANGHVFIFSGPPGAYDVGAFAQTPSGIVTMQTVVIFQPVVAPQPAPTPTPNPRPVPPQPGPAPTPTPFPSTQQRQPFPQTAVERGVSRG